MQIHTENLVSITEANQNFSKVARLVDETGAAVILKNNVPRYVLMDYAQFASAQEGREDTVEDIGKRILSRHWAAFEELAK